MNLIGNIYGRLKVISRIGITKHRNIIWHCLCECGNYANVRAGNLRSNHTKSCGCFEEESRKRLDNKYIKHGHVSNYTKSPTYKSWSRMIDRCTIPTNVSYKYYGLKGIVVCDRWRIFENFLKDMGIRPKDHHIDRINPYKNYTLDNCRWLHNSKMAQTTRKKYGAI